MTDIVSDMVELPYIYTHKRGNRTEVIRSPSKLDPVPEGYELHPVHYMGIENLFGSICSKFSP